MQLSPSDPPSRVLHLTQPVDGGVARVVTDLVRAQLAAGLHVTVACPDGPVAPGALRALGADVRHWHATRSPGPSLVGEVRRLAADHRRRTARPRARAQREGRAGRPARGAGAGSDGVPAARLVVRGGRRGHRGAGARWERCGGALGLPGGVRERGRAGDRGARRGRRARGRVIPNGIDAERFHPAAADAVRAGIPLLAGRRSGRAAGGVRGAAVPAEGAGRAAQRRGTRCCGGCRGRGSCWSGTARTPSGCGPWRPDVGAVRGGRRRRRALVPGRRSGRPAVAVGGHGAGAAGGDGVRAAGRASPTWTAARESLPPRSQPHCLVPPRTPPRWPGPSPACCSTRRCASRSGHQGRHHVLSTHDVRHTAEAVAGVYRELLGGRTPCRACATEYRESIHS